MLLFEFLENSAMQFVTEFLHSAPIRLQNDWGIVVGQLSFWFCVTKRK
jgi:hypothetical protein